MTPLETALGYIGRGWNPVPVAFRGKIPPADDWQKITIDRETAPRFFNGNALNVGVQLGPSSRGLTDIDLDCPEARDLASYILPLTKSQFGRKSAHASHRLYFTDLAATVDKAVINFDDPRTRARLLEVRIGGGRKGAQTVFPGSVHESGEAIVWIEDGDPASVNGDVLRGCAALLAACTLLARRWPGGGTRHEAAKILGGFFSRAGKEPRTCAHLVGAIAKTAGDEEWKPDRIKAAEDQAAARAKGKNTYGLPALKSMFGDDIASKVAEWVGYQSPQDNVASDAPKRATIRVRPGTLDKLATEAERALIEAGVPFYAHGEEIKRPVVDEVEATKGRKARVARFTAVTPDSLRDYLSRVAAWERFNERKKAHAPTDPPRDVAATILSRSGEWRFPRAVGVITTPTLRPDGTILSTPGYDPITRMVLIDPPAMPAVPEKPTRDMAVAALTLLNNLLAEFPFTDEPSRAVALSELITPVVRGAMTAAPLHANRAPTPGSGKSFLLDIVSAIVSGQPCPVISAGQDEYETEKRLGAALLRGQALISIDNLNGELRGDALCQIIERPIVDVRPLGVSRLVRIESRATLFATGNNLVLVGDVVRRVLLCSLDPDLERPELRHFKDNPFEAVLADRGRYIAAALTVVRTYIAADCPDTLPALASFEDWSRLVRSALVWLGCADPVETMETARAEDPELEALRHVIATWLQAIGPLAPQTAGQLRDHAEMKKSDYEYNGAPTFAHPDFRDALLTVAYGNGGTINTKALGRWLSRYRGRVIDGHKIVGREDTNRKQVVWSLLKAPGKDR